MRTYLFVIAALATGLLLPDVIRGEQADSLPQVGKPVPEFTLNNITYFDKQFATTDDFKGKWLFLDFWSTNCAACIKSFPKLSKLQELFKEDARFVLIGNNAVVSSGSTNQIEALFQKIKAKNNLQLISAYDSTLFNHWKIRGVPYLLIIDPDGIVRYITTGSDVNEEKVRDIIAGKPTSLAEVYDMSNLAEFKPVDIKKSGIIYQSLFAKWNGEKMNGYFFLQDAVDSLKKNGQVHITQFSLENMYSLAYLGFVSQEISNADSLYTKVVRKPIVERKDKEVLEAYYNYSLIIPGSMATEELFPRMLKEDLKRTFGFDVSVETRKMPVWNLVATKEASKKLKSKGGKSLFEPIDGSITRQADGSAVVSFPGGFKCVNGDFDNIFSTLMTYAWENNPPVINKAGIKGKVDIELDADMYNLEDIRRSLIKYGLDFQQDYLPMKVIVIK